MPRGDGTGPAGMGPMTGRAAGYCAGYGMPGYMNQIGGRGRGFWGRGGGRGWRHWYHATGLPGWARAPYGYPAWGPVAQSQPFYPGPGAATITAEQEIAGLKEQAQYFQNALDEINKRIEELGKVRQEE
jgi:hypothetical protein